jgi:hypothetical protein
MLGACPAPVLRHGRHRGERSTQSLRQERDRAVAHRDRDRAPYRRAVRDRAIHQRQERRGTPGRQADVEPAIGRRPSCLYACAVRSARSRARLGQSDQLRSQALGGLYPIPSGRARLPLEQRRRTRPEGYRPGSKIVAVLRVRSRRTARRSHVQSRRHGQNEWRRSAGLAHRRPLPYRNSSGPSIG